MLHNIFDSITKSRYLFSFPLYWILLNVCQDCKVHNSATFFFFLVIIIRSSCLAEIRWSVCISKSQRSLCISFSRTASGLCPNHLFVWSNLNLLHHSQWITLPTQSCLVLYSFCANMQHSLIMWLMVSSLVPHNLHQLFCCVLSILALIWEIRWSVCISKSQRSLCISFSRTASGLCPEEFVMGLFCAAIRRDSVSVF